MFTEFYIEDLLVDEEAADLIWRSLEDGQIIDNQAHLAWNLLATLSTRLEL